MLIYKRDGIIFNGKAIQQMSLVYQKHPLFNGVWLSYSKMQPRDGINHGVKEAYSKGFLLSAFDYDNNTAAPSNILSFELPLP